MKLKCTGCGGTFENLPQWQAHTCAPPSRVAEFVIEPEPTDVIPKVEPTPELSNECIKLLDNGWTIVLFKNRLGSYSAVATRKKPPDSVIGEGVITDNFTPARALYSLTEKVFGNIK